MKKMRKRMFRTAIELLCLMLALSMTVCAVPMMATEVTDAAATDTAEESTPATVSVVFAAQDIPQGTRLTEKHFVVKEVSAVNVPSNAVSNIADLVTRHAAKNLHEGEYVYLAQTSKDMVVAADERVLVKPITASKSNFLVVTDFIKVNSGLPVEFYLQQLIDKNPNKTLYFPAGEYILGSPIGTPADAQYSISIVLDDGAVLKAADNWKSNGTMTALVCLGASVPKNDISSPGSYYSIQGGVLDGNGKADGLSIDSGRESVIRNLCIKNAKTGIQVKTGANNKSSDCDFEDISIIGNGKRATVGMDIIGFDNTFSNIRIYDVEVGVTGTGAGNFFKSIFIINTKADTLYTGTKGFGGTTNNWYSGCYVENYETAYTLGGSGLAWDCTAVWNNDACKKQVAFSGGAVVPLMGCKASFHKVEGASTAFVAGWSGERSALLGCIFDTELVAAENYQSFLGATNKIVPISK